MNEKFKSQQNSPSVEVKDICFSEFANVENIIKKQMKIENERILKSEVCERRVWSMQTFTFRILGKK